MYGKSDTSIQAHQYNANSKYSLVDDHFITLSKNQTEFSKADMLKKFLRSRFSKDKSATRYKDDENRKSQYKLNDKFAHTKNRNVMKLGRVISKAVSSTPKHEVKSTNKFESFKSYANKLKKNMKSRVKKELNRATSQIIQHYQLGTLQKKEGTRKALKRVGSKENRISYSTKDLFNMHTKKVKDVKQKIIKDLYSVDSYVRLVKPISLKSTVITFIFNIGPNRNGRSK